MYGGTSSAPPITDSTMGLSPRVRGNLPPVLEDCSVKRSIPACTGEPCRHDVPWVYDRVYPRVYGGTSTEFIRLFAAMSLFPGVERDAVQIVKELFVLGLAGPPRQDKALLVHQLDRGRPQDSHTLSPRLTWVLPRHDNRLASQLQKPFLYHCPDPLSDATRQPRSSVHPRGNLNHARGQKPASARGNVTCHDYCHRRLPILLCDQSSSR